MSTTPILSPQDNTWSEKEIYRWMRSVADRLNGLAKVAASGTLDIGSDDQALVYSATPPTGKVWLQVATIRGQGGTPSVPLYVNYGRGQTSPTHRIDVVFLFGDDGIANLWVYTGEISGCILDWAILEFGV